MSNPPLTDDDLKYLRIQLRSVTSEPYAAGKALWLLDEVERLRAEEDAEGREIGRLHDALATYRNQLATANGEVERLRATLDAALTADEAEVKERSALWAKLATARRTLELLRPNVPNGADVKLIDHALEIIKEQR